MDSAWKSKHYEVVLYLLRNDYNFPYEFDVESLNKEDEMQRNLRVFAEERNRLHEWVKNDQFEKVKEFTSTNKSKFYFNDQNLSAAFTALKKRKLKIYAYLQSIGVHLAKDEAGEIDKLTPMEKQELQDAMLFYFSRNETCHIYHLMSKIKIKSKKSSEESRNQIFGYLEKLNQIPSLSVILKVVGYVENLELVLDLDDSNVKSVCPSATTDDEGLCFLSGIHVAAGGERTENEILGTLAHVFTHTAMHTVFKNDFKPYYESDDDGQTEFKNITNFVFRNFPPNPFSFFDVPKIPRTPLEILKEAFNDVYARREQEECEIIVRVPHILAQIPCGENWLLNNAPRLFEFFNSRVIPECKKFIEQSFYLKPKSFISSRNENQGKIVNIKKSALVFNNIENIRNFLNISNKNIFVLFTEYTRLGLFRVLQAKYGKNYFEFCDRFLVFKLESLVKNGIEVQYKFNFEATETLILECTEKINMFLQDLKNIMSIVQIKKNKKVVLIMREEENENIVQLVKSCGLLEAFVSETDEDFSLCELSKNSRRKILKIKILFQGTECILGDLIQDNEDLLKSMNAQTIQDLLDNQNIEIGRKPFGKSSLEGAYADIFQEANLPALIHEIKSTENIFVISGEKISNRKKEILTCLNEDTNVSLIAELKRFECKIPSNKRIFLTNEELTDDEFQRFCSFNPDKKVYLLKHLEKNNFMQLKVYNPNFYFERNFKKQNKIATQKDILQSGGPAKASDEFIINADVGNEGYDLQNLHPPILNPIDMQCEDDFEKLCHSKPGAHLLKFENDQSDWEKSSLYSVLCARLGKNSSEEVTTNENKSALNILDENVVICPYPLSPNTSLSEFQLWMDVTLGEDIFVNENKLQWNIMNEKGVIFAGEPGMGKSTTVTKLYENKNIANTHWVIKINLKDHLKAIKNMRDDVDDVEQVIEFLTEIDATLKYSITEKFLKAAIDKSKTFKKILVLCFDGFDELSDEEDRTKVINLLRFLKNKTKCRIWVTTSLHYKEILEDALLVLSLQFIPIDDSSKKNFIKNHMKNQLRLTLSINEYYEIFKMKNNAKLCIYTNQFFEKTKKIFKDDIEKLVGTPLQLHLLLEGSGQHFQKWIESSGHLDFSYLGNNLIEVYSKYFDQKCEIFFKKKHLLENSSKYVMKNMLENYHEQLADSLANNKPVVCQFIGNKSLLLVEGITKYEGENIQFVHFTFREYFFTQFLIKNLMNQDKNKNKELYSLFMKEILVKKKYQLIRSFINAYLENSENKEFFKRHEEGFLGVISLGYTKAYPVAIEEHNKSILYCFLSFDFSLATIKSVLGTHQYGNPLFHLAISTKNNTALILIIELAVKYNLNQELITAVDEKNNTAFYLAIKFKNYFAFNQIIELASKYNLHQYLLTAVNYDEETLFHLAVWNKNDFALNQNIPLVASTNNLHQHLFTAFNYGEQTLFHLAVRNKNDFALNQNITLVDLAWKLKHYETVLSLLQEDYYFPDIFKSETLNEEDEAQKNLKVFAEERNRLHEWIKNDEFDKVKVFTSENKSKFYFNNKNQSAAFIALKNKRFKTYAYLQSIGVNLTNNEKDEIDNLTEKEKYELQDVMLSYFPTDEKSHIYHLMSKIKLKSKKSFEQCREKLYGYLEKLNQIPSLSVILKVVKYDENLDLALDLEDEHVKTVCPSVIINDKGLRHLSSTHVAAGGKIPENEILGSLAHALTHQATFAVFKNDCNPYYKSDNVGKKDFRTIIKTVEGSVQTVSNTPSVTLRESFNDYYTITRQLDSELIARVAQILAQYPKEENWLLGNAPLLFEFFNSKVIPECEKYIMQNFLLKPKSNNRSMNENEGEIVNIKKSALEFDNIEKIKNFLNTSNKNIFALITDHTSLGVLRVLQAAYGADYVEFCDQFLVFKLKRVIKNLVDVVRLFDSEETEILFIECSSNLEDDYKTLRGIKVITRIAKKNKDKKVILVLKETENEKMAKLVEKCELNEAFVSKTDEDFSLCELSKNSRRKILESKILFQGTECILGDLIQDNEDLLKSMNAQIIQDLLDKKNIEIGRKPLGSSSLDGAYTDAAYEANLPALIHEINSTKNIFVISGEKILNRKEEIYKCLNETIDNLLVAELKNFEKQILSDKRIFLTNEELTNNDFQKFCNFNPDKKVYLLKYLEKCNFMLLKIYNPDFYFERKFYNKVIIKNDILGLEDSKNIAHADESDGADELDAIIIATDYVEGLPDFHTPNIKFLSTEESEIEFKRLSNLSKPVHLLKFENNQLVWKKSSKSLSTLRPWVDEVLSENIFVDEKELRSNIIKEKMVIFVEEPGMGKSTTITKLYEDKTVANTHWVIRINLKDHLQAIRKINVNIDLNQVITFLTEVDSSLANSMSKEFLKAALDRNKSFKKILLLCFDGFDELLDYKDRTKLKNLLVFLKDETKCKIWITNSLHYKEILEDALPVFRLKFVPIDDSSKEDIIKNYMKNQLRITLAPEKYNEIFEINNNGMDHSKLRTYADRLLRKAKDIFKGDVEKFIGTPLQLHLLLEDSAPYFQKWIENSGDLDFSYLGNNLVEVYGKYFDRKCEIYFRKQNVIEEREKCAMKENYEKYHEKLADSLVNNKQLTGKITENKPSLLSLGITKDEGNDIQFVHFTVREYFFTQFLIRVLTNRKEEKCQLLYHVIMEEILVKEKYQRIRSFIDVHLENDEKKKLFKSHEEGFLNVTSFTKPYPVAVKERKNYILSCLLSFDFQQDKFISILMIQEQKEPLFHLAISTKNDTAFNQIFDLAIKLNLFKEILTAVNKDEDTAFLLAMKCDNYSASDRIIESIDLAWKSRQSPHDFEVILSLLQKDHYFPKEFDARILDKKDEAQKNLELFAQERNSLHLLIEKDQFKEVKEFTSKNKSKFYFNPQKQSAAFTAIKNKKFKIYAYLQSIGVNLKKSEEDRKNLTRMEEYELQDFILSHLPKNEKAHIYNLMSKIKIKCSNYDDQCWKRLSGYFKKLNQIPGVPSILKVLQYVKNLDLIVDLDNSNVKSVCPSASKLDKGIAFSFAGTIYVAAGLERSENEILGTLAHEMTHMAMQTVFRNSCNPFFKSDNESSKEFKKIAYFVWQNIAEIENTPSKTLKNAFLNSYIDKNEHLAELIVRVPQILAQYNDDGEDWLKNNTPELLKFYRENVIPKCEIYIEENQNSFHLIRLNQSVNENEGEIVDIKKWGLFFENVDKLKSFFNILNQKVYLLITDYTRFGLIRALQAIYGTEYVEFYGKFLVFNLENVLKNLGDVEYLFNSEVTQMLFIECPNNITNVQETSEGIEKIMKIVVKKKDKKVILIKKKGENEIIVQIIKDYCFDDELISETDENFSVCELSEESRRKILESKILFQGTECKLGQLINENEDLLKCINAEIIKNILSGQQLEIGSKPFGISSLESAYADILHKTDLSALIHEINNSENFFIFKGKKILSKKQLLEFLNQGNNSSLIAELNNFEEQMLSNKRILLINEDVVDDEFQKFCSFNPDKKVYLLEYLEENSFKLLKVYDPNLCFKRTFKRLHKIIIKKDILHNECLKKSQVFVINTGNKNTVIDNKLQSFNHPNIRFVNDVQCENEFEKFCKSGTEAHLIKFESNQLVWKKSSNSLCGLRPLIDTNLSEDEKVDEKGFKSNIINEKVLIIADEPGTRKSATLTKLYNDKNIIETHWVIRINLKDHLAPIKEIKDNVDDVDHVIKFLTEIDAKLVKSIAKDFLKAAIDTNKSFTKKLLLYFDGFDECLDDKNRIKVINLLKFLKEKTKCKIWVTARLNFKEVLENELMVLSLRFFPIDLRGFIKDYMENRLRLTLATEKFKEIFEMNGNIKDDSILWIHTDQWLEKRKETFKDDFEKLIGTPSQLYLLLKGCDKSFQKRLENADRLGIS